MPLLIKPVANHVFGDQEFLHQLMNAVNRVASNGRLVVSGTGLDFY
jgi:hypothetical protein